jgi:prepilin-type processing-associated H-X9-DG protein
MLPAIYLAALLSALAPLPDQNSGDKAAAVVPLVGEEVAVVLYVDLTKADAKAFVSRVVAKLADEEDVRGAITAIDSLVAALKKAGAHDLFVLFDPADMPGFPVAVVPLWDGSDGQAIGGTLTGGGPKNLIRWPATETIRGAVVAGTPAAVDRIRSAKPGARPELAAALAGGGDAATVQVVIIPSTTQRRAIEESVPNLPASFGSLPITTITRDTRWATLAMVLEPRPLIRGVVQAKDADSANAIQSAVSHALDLLVQTSNDDAAKAGLAQTVRMAKPQARGDRVTLEADLEKTAELVAAPLRQAREAARRSQCINNLKQIALAMHNYHSTHSSFPAAYSTNKDGKPLLSWRVHILPFLAQKALYDEFHLDEPWDSTHNKALISRMPAPYTCPSGSALLAREGKTSYLVPRGPATIFPGANAVKLQQITDGTSNTILVVDASDAVAATWTKPDDWEVAPDFQTQGVFGHHQGGTNFGFADGSVRWLKVAITPNLLQALTTRSGGEVIDANEF